MDTNMTVTEGQLTPPLTIAGNTPVPATHPRGQTFLIGDEIYLRTFEVGDQGNATSWRNSVFPKCTSLMKQWIREELPKEEKNRHEHLAIIRLADDVIVGSAVLAYDDIACEIKPHVDPLYGDAGTRWKAQAIALLAGWLVDEHHRPAVHIALAATDAIVIEAVQAFGMREMARLRKMSLVRGERVDRIWFEYLNKGWLKTLGDPLDMELERTGSGLPRPVPPKVTLDGDPPTNAMLVGKRVYLRPEEKADSTIMAEWARKETETFFDTGRHLTSSVLHANTLDSLQEKSHPDSIWFSVCLRENDEFIGSVGLTGVDYVNQSAETGSFFHRPDYRGSGYGSEAKHLLLEYAFDILGLHMVESWVYFPNTRSAAALRKQGYREAGRINWRYSHNGRFGNFVLFDLLAEEWRAMPRGGETPG